MPNMNLRHFQNALRNLEAAGAVGVVPLAEAMGFQPGDPVPGMNEDWVFVADDPEPARGQGVVEALNVANEFLRGAQWRMAPPVRAGDELVPFGAGTNRKTGEELFRLILSGIKEIYDVDAVIAGGAVRDLVVGDTEGSKDVDVFIPMKWEDFNKNSDELGWQGKPGLLHKKPYKTVVAKTSSDRASAVVQGMPVDLVFMDGGLTPEGVDGFPVNAQKCVWNLQEGLVVSPDAKKDIEGKKFTISPKLTDKEAIKNIRDKVAGWLKRPCYKGWKVIEPEMKEWWQKQNDPHTVKRGKKEKKKLVWDIETDAANEMARWWR